MKPKIGVLALQGAFQLHRPHIEAVGAEYIEIINSDDFAQVDGLILPGGESGVILKLIEILQIEEALSAFMKLKPTWGICAGAILMARVVHNSVQKSFAAMDITIERNSYGTQLDSCEALIQGSQVSYIRAPKITQVGKHINTLATRDGYPCWVESGHLMATTFHPETSLATPSLWHRRFKDRLRIPIALQST